VTCPATCTNCTDLATCTTCISNLLVINGSCGCDDTNGSYLDTVTNTCISCSQKLPLCANCDYNSTNNTLSCIACSAGSFLINGSCSPCLVTCLNCTDLLTCGACAPGYDLNITNLCDCINCTTCNASGIVNCVTCDLTDPTNMTCTLCMPGTYLNAGVCTLCPVGCATCDSPTNCQSCSLPFISSSPAGQCVCNSISLVYYDPNNQTCSSCASILLNCTSCSSANYTTVCLNCITGSFVSNGSCTTCIYPCSACSTATLCSACDTSFTLINGSCTCDTDSQLFLDSFSNLCVSCTAITSPLCLSCAANSNATNTSGVACTSCPVGYFPDAYFLCSACPLTCTDCLGLTACSTCLDTY
jgi:proprotein convertase subtilisin/kexin type 5